MTNMNNTRSEIWKLIDSDPSLKLDLERNLINARALARYAKEAGVNGTVDAILSAIRRYPKNNELGVRYTKALNIVRQSSISTRSHVANIALKKGVQTQQILSSLFSCINYERGESLRLIQGDESIKVIIDEKNTASILALIPKSLILHVDHNLGEINLHLHPEAVKTPGILLVVASELARIDVNMTEVMSCVPEMLIFVDENDLMHAYQILFDLCHSKGL